MMRQLNSMCSRLEVHFTAMSKGLEPVDRSPTKNRGEVSIVPSAVIQMGEETRDGAIIGVLSFLNQKIPAGFKDSGSPIRILIA